MQDAGEFGDGGLEKSKKPNEVSEARRCEIDAAVALPRRVGNTLSLSRFFTCRKQKHKHGKAPAVVTGERLFVLDQRDREDAK